MDSDDNLGNPGSSPGGLLAAVAWQRLVVRDTGAIVGLPTAEPLRTVAGAGWGIRPVVSKHVPDRARQEPESDNSRQVRAGSFFGSYDGNISN